jgi:hypothetical protein
MQQRGLREHFAAAVRDRVRELAHVQGCLGHSGHAQLLVFALVGTRERGVQA